MYNLIFHLGSYFMMKDDHSIYKLTMHHLQTKPNRLPDDGIRTTDAKEAKTKKDKKWKQT